MSGFMEFGFGSGDDNLGGGKFEKFKGKQGDSYRASFAWWPTLDGGLPNLKAASPRFIAANRVFIQNVGYVLADSPEFAKLAGQPAKASCATILALWPTDRTGKLDKARLAAGEVDVKPWIFSRSVYDQLKTLHTEWPFGDVDVQIACLDTQFQKMNFTPCRESLLAKGLEPDSKFRPIVDKVLARVRDIESNIQGMLAQPLSLDKVREKLGGAGAAGPSARSTAADSSQIDSLIDDLITT